jgi:hypothetical protein
VLRYTNSHKQIAETSLHQTKQRLVHVEEQLAATKRLLDEARATARADAEAVSGSSSALAREGSHRALCLGCGVRAYLPPTKSPR